MSLSLRPRGASNARRGTPREGALIHLMRYAGYNTT